MIEPTMVAKPDTDWVMNHHIDISGTNNVVEILIDHDRNVLHVNVEGVCLLRICRADLDVKIKGLVK